MSDKLQRHALWRIAIRFEAVLTGRRQRLFRLHHDSTSQTDRPHRITALVGNLHAVGNHRFRLGLGILQLRRRLVARVGVVDVGQVDNGDFARVVASEEGGSFVQSLGNERLDGRNERHPGQARVEGLNIRGQDLASVGEVGHSVCGVVVDDHDIDISRGLQHRKDGVVLESLSSIDEGEFVFGGNESRARVGVEGVWVDRVFVTGAEFVRLSEDGREGGELWAIWDWSASFVEETARGA